MAVQASNPLSWGLYGALFGGGGDKNNVSGKRAAWDAPGLGAFNGKTILAPSNGEIPLTDLPQYGGAGGSLEAGRYYAGQDFKSIFGRNPTQSELSMLAQNYMSGDANISNRSGGQAAIADYAQQQASTPENIYKAQQQQLSDAYNKDKGTIDPQVAQLFQSNLGRDATDAEKAHFGMLLASGQDPYQLQQALQQTTEYNTRQTQQFTDQLKTQMQGINADYFSKYILPSIQSQNAAAGRTQDSSGYQAQLANAGQQQNYDLQNYLAQVQAQGYQGSVQNNAQNYQSLLGQQYGIQNAGISNSLSNQASNTDWQRQMQMYQMQQNAYSNFLNQYGRRNGNQGFGALAGGLAGAALGAHAGPAGAMYGYQAGSGLGGAAGSYL